MQHDQEHLSAVAKVIPQERVQQRTVEQTVDMSMPPKQEDVDEAGAHPSVRRRACLWCACLSDEQDARARSKKRRVAQAGVSERAFWQVAQSDETRSSWLRLGLRRVHLEKEMLILAAVSLYREVVNEAGVNSLGGLLR